MRDDVHVYLRDDLPPKVHELVSPCADGSYTILIDSHLNYESQLEAYDHAVSHIDSGHFDVDCVLDVQEIEATAHGMEGKEFVKTIKKKQRRESARISFLKKNGYDFFAAAERRWLEP